MAPLKLIFFQIKQRKLNFNLFTLRFLQFLIFNVIHVIIQPFFRLLKIICLKYCPKNEFVFYVFVRNWVYSAVGSLCRTAIFAMIPREPPSSTMTGKHWVEVASLEAVSHNHSLCVIKFPWIPSAEWENLARNKLQRTMRLEIWKVMYDDGDKKRSGVWYWNVQSPLVPAASTTEKEIWWSSLEPIPIHRTIEPNSSNYSVAPLMSDWLPPAS